MKEIEILVQVFDDEDRVLKALADFEFVGDKETRDVYYFDPLRDGLKPGENGRLNACFRLRKKAGKTQITFKNDHFDGDTWLYSDEYETDVGSEKEVVCIIDALGLEELLVINNLKRTYQYKNYVIEFERVDNLGLFLEVEYSTSDDVDVQGVKREIQSFIDSLGLSVSDELNAGKPELMLRKLAKV